MDCPTMRTGAPRLSRIGRAAENRIMARSTAAFYVLLLSYLLLVPHPLAVFGAAGAKADEAIEKTHTDYLQHAIAYAGLAVVSVWASVTSGRRWNRAGWVWAVVAVHATAAEALQIYVPNRVASGQDAAANLAGIGMGWLALWLFSWWLAQEASTARISRAGDTSARIVRASCGTREY